MLKNIKLPTISLSRVASLMSLSILRHLRERTGLTVLRDSTSENISLENLVKALVPHQKRLLQKMILQNHKPSPAPQPKIALSFILQGNQKKVFKNIFLSPNGSGSATPYKSNIDDGVDIA